MQTSQEQAASLFCSIDKIEVISRVMICLGPKDWPESWDRKDLYQNFGTHIEDEADSIKKIISDIENADENEVESGKVRLYFSAMQGS